MRDKEKLREQLLKFYFIEEDRIPITSLVEKITPIMKIWEGLRKVLVGNVEYFADFSDIEMVKIIPFQDTSYLFIKTGLWEYFIINLDSKEVLNESIVKKIFNESFFIENFNELRAESEEDFLGVYIFLGCKSKDRIIDFCLEYEDTLTRTNKIVCDYTIEDAWTYLSLDLASGSGQLGFQTPDQFLYECLHFNLDEDLTAWGMQDAHQSMGIEKTKEILEKIKKFQIPISCIPIKFLNQEWVAQIRKLELKEKN